MNHDDPHENPIPTPLSADEQAKVDALNDAEIRRIEHAYRAWELTQTERSLLEARARHFYGADDYDRSQS
jgi:hypothetical protein